MSFKRGTLIIDNDWFNNDDIKFAIHVYCKHGEVSDALKLADNPKDKAIFSSVKKDLEKMMHGLIKRYRKQITLKNKYQFSGLYYIYNKLSFIEQIECLVYLDKHLKQHPRIGELEDKE